VCSWEVFEICEETGVVEEEPSTLDTPTESIEVVLEVKGKTTC
jgi:hypothetical protein